MASEGGFHAAIIRSRDSDDVEPIAGDSDSGKYSQ